MDQQADSTSFKVSLLFLFTLENLFRKHCSFLAILSSSQECRFNMRMGVVVEGSRI